MPRPPLPLGTMGEIRYYPAAGGTVRARALFRDYDGRSRLVERTGRTRTAATARLKEACRDRGRTDAAADITAETTVAALAELWHVEIAEAVRAGDRSPGTGRLYRDRLDKQVIPGLGELRLREVTVGRVDRLLRIVRDRHGLAVARVTRTVLSGMFGLAVRHDAITTNPVRDVAMLRGGLKKPPTALTLEQVADMRTKLAADERAQDLDVVDFVDVMLATGLRIGEASAITWASVDLDAGTIEVRGTVLRVTGEGLFIKPKPKSKAGWRVVELPTWGADMLRRRRRLMDEGELPQCERWDVAFPSPMGNLRDPSNTQSDLRRIFDRLGFPSVTSHAFRRTVATLMDQAGLSARAAADQLGHANVSMTTDHYFGRRLGNTGASAVLEVVAGAGKT